MDNRAQPKRAVKLRSVKFTDARNRTCATSSGPPRRRKQASVEETGGDLVLLDREDVLDRIERQQKMPAVHGDQPAEMPARRSETHEPT